MEEILVWVLVRFIIYPTGFVRWILLREKSLKIYLSEFESNIIAFSVFAIIVFLVVINYRYFS